MTCILYRIVEGKVPCRKVWGDEHHLAFPSIFPNTDGFTVVIPKRHYSNHTSDMPPQALADLMLTTQKVAEKLDKTFPDVSRASIFFEDFGVDRVYSKLSPMHGTDDLTRWKLIKTRQNKFFGQYEGYLSSHDHERADNAKLAVLAARIREA